MNEVMKTILERQTIRSYKPEQITDEQLELLIKAAKQAPSGRLHLPPRRRRTGKCLNR